MRTLASACTLTAAATATLLLAPTAYATAPGDNGTVKVHDAATGEELRKNEPHVCTFYLDAFGFDAAQAVDWRIEAWPPTAKVKGEVVKTGSLTLDTKGHGRSQDQALPSGHYKLFWNFDGEHGKAKHKVFWVDCGEDKPGDNEPGGNEPGGGEPGGNEPGVPGASTSPGAPGPEASPASPDPSAPSDAAQPTAAPSSSDAEDSAAKPASTPSAGAEGDLAETGTGAPVGLLSAAAAALVAAGGFLVIRRRKAQQQH